jgi:hypothetical protein
MTEPSEPTGAATAAAAHPTGPSSGPKFPLGQTVATPGALEALERVGQHPLDLLRRHARGDWGELSADDQAANDAALADGGRLMSSYVLVDGRTKVWVISEQDRSVTTLLLPEEY